jgi:glutathione S-transferase
MSYRFVPLPPPGSHKSPEHLKRHPSGRIPVLQVDDFTLYETH